MPPEPDLAEVVGQHEARRALEVAAAGGHHLYLVGPPGGGETMLAERLPGLLPELDDTQAMEVTAIASVLGKLGPRAALERRPPFVAPRHGASAVAVGGGSARVLPGAVTQAHHGVLFLDEAPEFQSSVIQALRQPIESGEVVVSRAAARHRFRAGSSWYWPRTRVRAGSATARSALSLLVDPAVEVPEPAQGPVLDRVDIQVFVPAPSKAALLGAVGESSAEVAARVTTARERQAERWSGTTWRLNGHVRVRSFVAVDCACPLPSRPRSTRRSTAACSPCAATTAAYGWRGRSATFATPIGRPPTTSATPWRCASRTSEWPRELSATP